MTLGWRRGTVKSRLSRAPAIAYANGREGYA